MDLVGQIFALIAIPSTLILLVQTILVLFGGDGDLDDGIDLNGNGHIDTPGDGGADGMALFSLRGIMAMAAVGGWSGLVMHEAGINIVVTVILAVAFGFMALVGIAWIMKLSARLQSSGNIDLGYAIERFIEVNAVTTTDRKLTTGESVRVVATDETGMLVVEPIAK